MWHINNQCRLESFLDLKQIPYPSAWLYNVAMLITFLIIVSFYIGRKQLVKTAATSCSSWKPSCTGS